MSVEHSLCVCRVEPQMEHQQRVSSRYRRSRATSLPSSMRPCLDVKLTGTTSVSATTLAMRARAAAALPLPPSVLPPLPTILFFSSSSSSSFAFPPPLFVLSLPPPPPRASSLGSGGGSRPWFSSRRSLMVLEAMPGKSMGFSCKRTMAVDASSADFMPTKHEPHLEPNVRPFTRLDPFPPPPPPAALSSSARRIFFTSTRTSFFEGSPVTMMLAIGGPQPSLALASSAACSLVLELPPPLPPFSP
mmetsp:Transcript_64141/g.125976  ORF Transcript_64141/g.125976 Transcript_64141/m.125976 type:complete len:246 (-) Transcript_64141:177-914(-)